MRTQSTLNDHSVEKSLMVFSLRSIGMTGLHTHYTRRDLRFFSPKSIALQWFLRDRQISSIEWE